MKKLKRQDRTGNPYTWHQVNSVKAYEKEEEEDQWKGVNKVIKLIGRKISMWR